jgi:hypothetical protein
VSGPRSSDESVKEKVGRSSGGAAGCTSTAILTD